MKRALLALLLPCVLSVSSYACIRQSTVRTALDVAQIACVLINDTLDDPGKLAEVCGVAEALLPEVKQLVAGRKAASSARAARGHDAGADK